MGGWLTIGATPLLLAALLVGYMYYEQAQRNLPNTVAHKVGRMAAVTLLEGHARLRYPHRLETARLVMYHDDRVTDAAGDAAAMDAHLARMEEILGRRQHSRIYWVRGPSMGMGAMCIHSVALGSQSSPALDLDRHELAHAFMYQFSRPQAEPPKLLLEGWAMAVDGHPGPFAPVALTYRGTAASCLEEILRPESYHAGREEAYWVGGALVDHLLRRYTAEQFLEIYNACHPKGYQKDFERVYGISFRTMEQEFWREMEEAAKPPG